MKSATPKYKRMLKQQGKYVKLAPKYRRRLLACKNGDRCKRFV